jgi:uncharacterized coiled-coil protein SlyX
LKFQESIPVDHLVARESAPSPAHSFDRGRTMIAESNSNIAWHRVQLKKNREALKALEIARFRVGEMTGAAGHAQEKTLTQLKHKIAESQRCIAAHERRTKRPLATDLRSLAQVSWGSWDAYSGSRQAAARA